MLRMDGLAARCFVIAAASVLGACARAPAPIAPDGAAQARYAEGKSWLCLPGRDDACARSLDATELRFDGTRVVVRDTKAPGADDVDCFYVYPTVDLSLGAANHEDFTDLAPMTRVTVAQAARFRNVCTLYVPLYRQITIGAYLRAPDVKRAYTAVAEADVDQAFAQYLRSYNGGRKIVLVGHSQGGEMVVHLLQRFFDRDPELRARLLLAMPIGWLVEVPKGKTVGGSFANVPVCTRAGETGCVVAYRSFAAGSEPESKRATPAEGNDAVCVNPAELAHGPGHAFSRAFLPMGLVAGDAGLDAVTTPFVLLRDFYGGTCKDGPRGTRYLAVSSAPATGDRRTTPIRFSSLWLRGELGLHLLDMQFAQGDLLDLVAERAAPKP